MNTENESSNINVPQAATATPPQVFYQPSRKEPFIRLPFFLWGPLFVFVMGLLVYFFYPDALNQLIKLAYGDLNKYAPQATAVLAPHPVVAAAPAPVTPPAPTPVQTYTLQEIKDGVQDHLLQFGIVDKGTAFDWKKLEYSDPSDLSYELYAHLARGTTEFCMGTVVLDMQEHHMSITSQLQGW